MQYFQPLFRSIQKRLTGMEKDKTHLFGKSEIKIFAIFGIAILVLFFAFVYKPTPSQVDKGRDAYERYFNSSLRDPDSFVLYDESYTEYDEDSVVWEIEYGARNGFGGLNRSKVHIVTIGSTVVSCTQEKDY